jgi:hypothetical protein
MRYDIVKIEDATPEQTSASTREHNGYYIIKNNIGDYDQTYTKNFTRCTLLLEEYDLAIKYADYHTFDYNRVRSGSWMSAIITGKILHMRDTGDITTSEKLELENMFLSFIGLLSAGHWITTKDLANTNKGSLSSQKLIDIVDEFILDLDAYITDFY